MKKPNVYEIVTERILTQLKDVNPNDWKKPWFTLGHGIPKNAETKKPYKGINIFLLSSAPYWATFKAWDKLGCKVNKGEKASPCAFYSILEKDGKDGKKEKVFLFRYYSVFSINQVSGEYADELRKNPLPNLNTLNKHDLAEKVTSEYLARENIKVNQADSAFYQPVMDNIGMPLMGQFDSAENYYSTLFHEIAHSTGHSSRLDRKLTGQFGTEDYAKEELVAELTAAMLCAETGLSNLPRPDHAQYLRSWLRKLQDDPRYIVQAASQAQKAASFIMDNNSETEAIEEDSEAA